MYKKMILGLILMSSNCVVATTESNNVWTERGAYALSYVEGHAKVNTAFHLVGTSLSLVIAAFATFGKGELLNANVATEASMLALQEQFLKMSLVAVTYGLVNYGAYKISQHTRQWLEEKYSLVDTQDYEFYRGYAYNAGKYITLAKRLLLPLVVYGLKESYQNGSVLGEPTLS